MKKKNHQQTTIEFHNEGSKPFSKISTSKKAAALAPHHVLAIEDILTMEGQLQALHFMDIDAIAVV